MKQEKTGFFRRLGLPRWGWLGLFAAFVWNILVFVGTKPIIASWRHYTMETALDRAIPLLPWTLIIYFGAFAFWAVNYILALRQGEDRARRFLTADILSKTVCLVFFLALPTTNTRPPVDGESFWYAGMRFLYAVDTPENLFPSIHCLASWLCYIGVRRQKSVPLWYRIFSCAMAIAVFLSTLTTKQHVLLDVAGGAALAEISWFIAGRTSLPRKYGRLLERLSHVKKGGENAEG